MGQLVSSLAIVISYKKISNLWVSLIVTHNQIYTYAPTSNIPMCSVNFRSECHGTVLLFGCTIERFQL